MESTEILTDMGIQMFITDHQFRETLIYGPRIDVNLKNTTRIVIFYENEEMFQDLLFMLNQEKWHKHRCLIAVTGNCKWDDGVCKYLAFYPSRNAPNTFRGVNLKLRITSASSFDVLNADKLLFAIMTHTAVGQKMAPFDTYFANRGTFVSDEFFESLCLNATQSRLKRNVRDKNKLNLLLQNPLDLFLTGQLRSLTAMASNVKGKDEAKRILIENLKYDGKVKLKDGDPIPNFWGVKMEFNVTNAEKQRHYWFHGSSGFGKSTFIQFLTSKYKAVLINPGSRTQINIAAGTQIVLMDEISYYNKFTPSDLNGMCDNTFFFKKLFQNEFSISNYIVIVLSNYTPDEVYENYYDWNLFCNFFSRFNLVPLSLVEKFHGTNFRAFSQSYVDKDTRTSWATVEPYEEMTLPALVNLYMERNPMPLENFVDCDSAKFSVNLSSIQSVSNKSIADDNPQEQKDEVEFNFFDKQYLPMNTDITTVNILHFEHVRPEKLKPGEKKRKRQRYNEKDKDKPKKSKYGNMTDMIVANYKLNSIPLDDLALDEPDSDSSSSEANFLVVTFKDLVNNRRRIKIKKKADDNWTAKITNADVLEFYKAVEKKYKKK